MKKINLINKEKSDVDYEITTFPDGERHLKLFGELDRKSDYLVICRITNGNELFELMQIGNILNRQAVKWELDIFYLMTMRMDRVISFNEAYSLEIVANIINGLNPARVRVFHSHSSKVFDLIHNCYDMEKDYNYDGIGVESSNFPEWHICICYPDKGARERYGNKGNDIIVLNKVRDDNGYHQVKSIEIGYDGYDKKSCDSIIVCDDLCDAGGTFIGAAKVLKEAHPDVKISILVRHMVNPKGIENLCANYDKVYITNSYKDWNAIEHPSNLYVFNVTDDIYKNLF